MALITQPDANGWYSVDGGFLPAPQVKVLTSNGNEAGTGYIAQWREKSGKDPYSKAFNEDSSVQQYADWRSTVHPVQKWQPMPKA